MLKHHLQNDISAFYGTSSYNTLKRSFKHHADFKFNNSLGKSRDTSEKGEFQAKSTYKINEGPDHHSANSGSEADIGNNAE